MGKFSNLRLSPDPKTLYWEEIAAINGVLEELLSTVYTTYTPIYGTFVLVGQKDGAAAQEIIHLNLACGESTGRINGEQARSDHMVDASIQAALKQIAFDPARPFIDTRGLYAASIKTTYGRFILSFHSYIDQESCGYDEMHQVTIGLALALSLMGKEDTVLQDSVSAILRDLSHNEPQLTAMNQALARVHTLFSQCEIPALRSWKAWHEPANSNNQLVLFFE